jgi:hypothetical protein
MRDTSSNAEWPVDGAAGPADAVEIDLKAAPTQAFLAVLEATARAGYAVEAVESARPPDGRCRVTTRRVEAAAPAHPGAPLLVYEIFDAGGGVARVRITQSGCGDQDVWSAAAHGWGGQVGGTPLEPPSDPPVGWPRAPGVPPGAPDLRLPDRGRSAGAHATAPYIRALADQLERACARLALTRPAASPRWPGTPPW